MSYFVTKYPAGTLCWADVTTTDFPKTKKFLEGLFGWSAEDMPMGNDMMYTMFSLQGKHVAGGSQFPAFMPSNIPSHWNNYIAVDDIDAAVARALELGGKISIPPMDVMQAGRMADIEDSTGAHIELWQAKKHIGAQMVNTIGAMGWNELYTLDVEKSKEFYGELLGWTFDSEDSGYTMIFNKGRMNGGILQLTQEMEGMQQGWIPYFSVSSSEETIKKTTELGGKVLLSRTIPQGKIALISEPAGAVCMTIESLQKPEEWIE